MLQFPCSNPIPTHHPIVRCWRACLRQQDNFRTQFRTTAAAAAAAQGLQRIDLLHSMCMRDVIAVRAMQILLVMSSLAGRHVAVS